MIIPAYQSLLHLMIQIDLLTEVQWKHSTCAQVQYNAEVCQISMQGYPGTALVRA